jgi:hypothetical protein
MERVGGYYTESHREATENHRGGEMQENKSEMMVILKAKELCSYIMTVTMKSPKQFRFTFVTRLQNLALDVVEKLYYANEIFIGSPPFPPHSASYMGGASERRLSLQHEALTTLKLIVFVAEMSM